MDENYLRASNGSGEAVMAVVTTERPIGSLTLITDSVLNWPHRGVATSGDLDPDTGLIDPSSATVFKYHLDGSIITIDEFAPGYPDTGNTEDQVVVVKPTTLWADLIAEMIGEGGGANVHIGNTPPPDPEEGDLWGDTSEDNLNELVTAVGSLLMPVGFILTTNNSANPATYYGFGTWSRIEGRLIVGVSDSDGDFDLDDTGGAKSQSLTNANLPRYNGTVTMHGSGTGGATVMFTASGSGISAGTSRSQYRSGGSNTAGANSLDGFSLNIGQSTPTPVPTLPPYIAKYIWERTA